MLLAAGCYAGYYSSQVAAGDAAVGEQHDVPYTSHDAFLLTEDVLRGEGVLFEVKPDDKLVTLWRDADTQGGVLGGIVGVHPQYRYEIEVVPARPSTRANHRQRSHGGHRGRRHFQVQSEHTFEHLRQSRSARRKFPPEGGTPNEGGVNYALLPNEDLKALARRATGNEDNWQIIAQDNGLKSPSDTSGCPAYGSGTACSFSQKGCAGK